MKNEEAIEILENIAMAESTFSDEESKKCCEAIDLAVEALKRDEPSLDEALTLEQLREMEGEPVWVERNENPHDGKWVIVDYADTENSDKTLYTKEGVTYSDYGKYFTAYAYPPSRIDMDEWVSVKDDLPEDGEEVIAFAPKQKKTFVGYVIRGKHKYDKPITWFLCGAMHKKYTVTMSVSHWRKKPEEPK